MGCFACFLPIKLAEAEIRAITPAGGGTHRVRFILKTYKLEKKDDLSEIGAPGLNGEPLQFVRGHSRTLSMVRAGDAVTDGLAVIRAACLLPYRPVSMTD